MKIKICTPWAFAISQATRDSVEEAKKHFDIEWQDGSGALIDVLRNALIIGKDCTHVRPKLDPKIDKYLMLDSDVAFKPEHLQKLIDDDKDIVGGAYRSSRDCNFYAGGDFGVFKGDTSKPIPFSCNSLIKVDWIHAGFTLYDKSVFEELDAPWFHRRWIEFVDPNGAKHKTQAGEDISFCIYAKDMGYDIWMDCSFEVEHITNKEKAYGGNGREKVLMYQGQPISIEKLSIAIHKNITKAASQILEFGEAVDILAEIASK